MEPILTTNPDLDPDLDSTEEGIPPGAGGPADSGDAAATQEFARSLSRLRRERGFDLHRLAAEADNKPEAIRDYEAGKFRPKQPKLWKLAQALDVMPITLGPGSTRNNIAPVPTETLLRQRGSRALRVQRLVEILAFGRVSVFAQLLHQSAAEVYALAATESQLSDLQLEPLLRDLPQVRRPWLLSGEGDCLTPESERPLPPAPAAEPAPSPAPAGPPQRGVAVDPVAAPLARPLAVAARPDSPRQYVPLGGGQVAEVSCSHLGVSQIRFLAGAGEFPVLTTLEQLDTLYEALRALLPAGEEAGY